MPGERLAVRLYSEDHPDQATAAFIRNSPLEEQALDQSLRIPNGAALRLVRLLPHAVLHQDVVADDSETSGPAIHVAIEGPTQSVQRWLVAGDPERNRLSGYIATWRYMAVANQAERDELFGQFSTEFTRDPILRVTRSADGLVREVPAVVGQAYPLEDLGCHVRILQFLPDAAIQGTDTTPINRSSRRRNPAALVEVRAGGAVESHWAFAKFPDFAQRKDTTLPFRLSLDCPIEGSQTLPDFVMVSIAEGGHEVWTRVQGRIEAGTLDVNSPVQVAGSQYRFRVVQILNRGRIVEGYQADPANKAPPAIQCEYLDQAERSASLWVALGHQRRILTAKGAHTVSFELEQSGGSPAHP
jgi:hypothetical protein